MYIYVGMDLQSVRFRFFLNVGSFLGTAFNSWFGTGTPLILPRSLQNGTKNTGGTLCVCTPHTQ